MAAQETNVQQFARLLNENPEVQDLNFLDDTLQTGAEQIRDELRAANIPDLPTEDERLRAYAAVAFPQHADLQARFLNWLAAAAAEHDGGVVEVVDRVMTPDDIENVVLEDALPIAKAIATAHRMEEGSAKVQALSDQYSLLQEQLEQAKELARLASAAAQRAAGDSRMDVDEEEEKEAPSRDGRPAKRRRGEEAKRGDEGRDRKRPRFAGEIKQEPRDNMPLPTEQVTFIRDKARKLFQRLAEMQDAQVESAIELEEKTKALVRAEEAKADIDQDVAETKEQYKVAQRELNQLRAGLGDTEKIAREMNGYLEISNDLLLNATTVREYAQSNYFNLLYKALEDNADDVDLIRTAVTALQGNLQQEIDDSAASKNTKATLTKALNDATGMIINSL